MTMPAPTTTPSFWTQITTWVDDEFNAVMAFLKNFFSTLLQNEVAALQPIAENAVATLGTDLTQVTTLSGIAPIVGQIAVATATAAEAAGITAAGSSLIAAVGGAISNAQAKTN